MKNALLVFVAFMLLGANISLAQKHPHYATRSITDKIHVPKPHHNVAPGWMHSHQSCSTVSYDAASTVLTVKFPTNGGSVTVSHNGAQVASMTAGSGTTFHSELRQYGTGNYTVIVSNGNTVVETKNFTVR